MSTIESEGSASAAEQPSPSAASMLTAQQYRRAQRRYRRRKLVPVVGFLAPFITLWAVFLAVPMIWGIWLSFNTGGIIGPAEWVGTENWSRMWRDSELRRSVQNTGIYMLIAISVAFTLAFMLAMLLDYIGRGKNFYKVALYFPLLVPPIMAGMIFLFLTHYDVGALNMVLRTAGLERVNFLGENPNALLTIVALEVWRGLGFWVLFFLAALQSVPSDLIDAAKVDGASAPRRFFRVALPTIRPLLLFALVIAVIFNAQLFDSVQVLTKGGPVLGTSSVVWFIYKRMFAFQDIGLAYATSVGLLLIVIFLTVIAYGVLGPRADRRN